jgi:FlaA1/EpsC-like NDP-sugar epimerase
MVLIDILLLSFSLLLSYLLRFEGDIPVEFLTRLKDHIVIIVMVKITIYYFFQMYNSLWIYASEDELMKIAISSLLANGAILSLMFFMEVRFPRSIYIINTMIDIVLMGGFRFSYRVFRRLKQKGNLFSNKNFKRTLIVGAGDTGALIIKELMKHNKLKSKPIALIDDDPMKLGKRIHGIPVLGNRNDILKIVKAKRIDEIIIAIPSVAKQRVSEIVKICNSTGCQLKILPGVYELINGQVNISEIRNVELEDLLGRDEVHLDTLNIRHFLDQKTVLVTGSAGSIGSELIRQLLKFNPAVLVLVDHNENGLYGLEYELTERMKRASGQCTIHFVVASIRDRKRMAQIFEHYKPNIVFHAAAHKHVPLMESNPIEAIKNNILGTENLVEIADRYGVQKFVLISTDKAVNPTNVMGATKRVAEMIIQNHNQHSKTDFVAVRFGNVLGSNGSVIPLFMKQIENGGPVTVTHPEITRFFMTIPEASQLVLQAGAIAKGGEVFILDMGEPVKILELAENLIKLSGYVPYDEIDIEFTGLRPGEKLYEELMLKDEELIHTQHKKIFVSQSSSLLNKELKIHLDKVREKVDQIENGDIRQILKELVPEYRPVEDEVDDVLVRMAK